MNIEGKKPSIILLTIENVSATLTINKKIDLKKLVEYYKDLKERTSFPGVVGKISDPKATILIFKSGKIILTGIKRVEDIQTISKQVLNKINSIKDGKYSIISIQIDNITAKGDYNASMDLNIASQKLLGSSFEPEYFPGLIYKKEKPNVCFILFSSGKVIITGAKDEELLINEIKILSKNLKKFNVFGDKSKNTTEIT